MGTYYFILMVKQFKWYPAENVSRKLRTKRVGVAKLRKGVEAARFLSCFLVDIVDPELLCSRLSQAVSSSLLAPKSSMEFPSNASTRSTPLPPAPRSTLLASMCP